MVEAVLDSNFEQATSEGLVLIDFWATWCGPCRMQGPILEQIAEQYEDNLTVLKMDVDENPATAQNFGIMSIPTLILKKDGEIVETLIGVHQKAQLTQIIDQYI